MSVIDKVLKTKWSWVRWMRLFIGMAFLVDAYYKNSIIVAAMGAFLAFQAIFNLGCASNECANTNFEDKPINTNFKNIKKLNKS